MHHRIERLSRQLVRPGEAVDFYTDTVRLPDGREEKWDFVHHKAGGGACVVPVLDDGRIVLVRQYRPAIDTVLLELPAGKRDTLADGSREPSAVTARRELEEETGLRCSDKDFRYLMSVLAAPAYLDEQTDIFIAEHAAFTGKMRLDEEEEIEVLPLEVSWLRQEIFAGRIRDAKTCAGILGYLACRTSE